MHALDGARSKIARGSAQLKSLNAAIVAALDPAFQRVSVQGSHRPFPKPAGHPDLNEWIAVTFTTVEVPTLGPEIGPALGEIVHDFRSALDYVAWELVGSKTRRGLSKNRLRQIEFPMCPAPKQFNDYAARCLPSVSSLINRALFAPYQPYRRTDNGRAIRHLQRLSNADKHRAIVPSVVFPIINVNEVTPIGGGVVMGFTNPVRVDRELKPGTDLFTVILSGGVPGQSSVNLHSHLEVDVGILRPHLYSSHGGPAVTPLDKVMAEIERVCSAFVENATKYF
jgi:hypothetical protein